MDSLLQYLGIVPSILNGGDRTPFEISCKNEMNISILEQFITSDSQSVLQVSLVPASDNVAEEDKDNYVYRYSLDVSYVGEGAASVVFIKRNQGALDSSVTMSSQLQMIVLGDVKGSGLITETSGDKSSTKKTIGNQTSNAFDLLQNYVHYGLTPLLNSYSERIQVGDKEEKASKLGVPNVAKKLAELEVALVHCQQNMDIPQVILPIDPLIKKAASIAVSGGKSLSNLEDLGLGPHLSDSGFINNLQAGVVRWIKEILKVTKLTREPGSGSAIQEINFWQSFEKALIKIEHQLTAPEIEITMNVMKQAKRFLVTVQFENETGLAAAKSRVDGVMTLMRDFPINQLISATDINGVIEAIVQIFSHMRKIKTASQFYSVENAFQLIEALSRDVSSQVLKILGKERLMQLSFEKFQSLTKGCTDLSKCWSDQQGQFRDLIREINKKRGGDRTISAKPAMEHQAILERVFELCSFRAEHQKFRDIIQNVSINSGSSKHAGNNEAVISALNQVDLAYQTCLSVDVLDISPQGNSAWDEAKEVYNLKIATAETSITGKLRERLGAANSPEEMYRIFSRFNTLFFRARIQGEIQPFQSKLILNIEENMEKLQTKFKRQYNNTETQKMSEARDLPPFSGAIIWAKQIERQLLLQLQRTEIILGKDWESHVEGKKLKALGDAFQKKLDTTVIFENWVNTIKESPNMEVSGRIFTVEDKRSGLELLVNYDPAIITLFKEVRNLQSMGFRVPYTIKVTSDEAKEKYPLAMSLKETLRTYRAVSAQIVTDVATLVSSFKFDIQEKIRKAFSKALKWDSDGLEGFVKQLSEGVMGYQDKVIDILSKYKELQIQIDLLKTCPFIENEFSSILEKIQLMVDNINLNDYSNVSNWAKRLDEDIEIILLDRLKVAVNEWILCFTTSGGESTDRKRSESTSVTSSNLLVTSIPPLEETVHEINIKNQTLFVEPALQEARINWMNKFNQSIYTICNLNRIQGSRYDNVLKGNTLAANVDLRYKSLRSRIPSEFINQAYNEIENRLASVDSYVNIWLGYQSLWDLQASQIYNELGNDLNKWQKLLIEIQAERGVFDTSETFKRFGPIIIDYERVQTKVNFKYDSLHKEVINRFGQLYSESLRSFYNTISQHRLELEKHSLDGPTSEVIEFVKLIHDLKKEQPKFQASLDSFESGQTLLEKQHFDFPNEWLWLSNVDGEWQSFLQILRKRNAAMEDAFPNLQKTIQEEDKSLKNRINDLQIEWNKDKPLSGDLNASSALSALTIFNTRMVRLKDEVIRINRAKEALSLEISSVDLIIDLQDELTGLQSSWNSIAQVWVSINSLRDTLWSAVNGRKIRASLDEIIDSLKSLPSQVQQYDAFQYVSNTLKQYKNINKLLVELKTDALKDRHWKNLLRILNIKVAFGEMTLGGVWSSNLMKSESAVRDVIRTAQGEMALEEFLRQIRDYWSEFQLDLVNYQNKSRLIRGWDELFAKLDENLSSLGSMKQSPYFAVFEELSLSWESKLTRLRLIFDSWIDVQRKWVYLEGIFNGSADIKQQLPNEYTRFKTIDNEFVTLMRKVSNKPQVMELLNIEGLQRTLERLEDLLSKIQRALGEYLERQRSMFSRFYFVGDEDLLEMIGNGKDPIKIQRHMGKIFAGISSLMLLNDGEKAGGMSSREGEQIPFKEPVDIKSDPKVNIWLRKVELQMQFTLASLLDEAIVESSKGLMDTKSHREWVDKFPAMIVLLSTQVSWSSSVRDCLRNGGGSSLDAPLKQIETLLQTLADRVLLKLPNDRRKKYEQLITEHVYQRDVTRKLVTNKIKSDEDFEWRYHMRYNYNPSTKDLLTKLEILIANASFSYGWEYLGVVERLVQTPLTDRCYLTLTQALHLRMGGNPFGPAGTGKTESVKMLGAQLGRFVLVFNCDETFDFQAMGRIFRGLCQVGAWGCFDEFNRLEERILSAVSQQILSIQTGLLNRSSEIEIIGKVVTLSSNVGIFVTMNPGYAGRSNLPDNLKQLFRSIAMIKPDWELIAQVMLFSQGFRSAETLAGKIVLLFSLCDDQLSSQPHYDFGLRALKSVLVSAGNLKREQFTNDGDSVDSSISTESIDETERQFLIQSVCQTAVPKLVADDLPLFSTLLAGVFPGSNPLNVGAEKLKAAIQKLCDAQNYVHGDSQWFDKVLQLYMVLELRHGVMMVGPSGSGKTSSWRILLQAMEAVDGIKGESYVIDPKAISKDELYGVLDGTTLEWKDGIFTHILRGIINNVRGESSKRHWIIFDGDVDPEWAENLNSVLDDNKLLTLPSGERLNIPTNVRLMFEVETLRYATLATVSRCGMVWYSTETLTNSMILSHSLKCLKSLGINPIISQLPSNDDSEPVVANLYDQVAEILAPFYVAGGLISKALEISLSLFHIMETKRQRLIESMQSLVIKGVNNIIEYNESHLDFPMAPDHVERYITKWLIFSILWGFGGSVSLSDRTVIGENLKSLSDIPFPKNGIPLIDVEVDISNGEWRPWKESVPLLDIESHKVVSTDVVITTVDTVRHTEVLGAWLAEHRPLILCGPPGSGKTMTLTSTLQSMPELELAPLNFSSGTTPALILKTFEQYCVYKKTPNGIVLHPSQPGKWLVVFCDEINLPEADQYGTQCVISFLRQMTEQGGFWRAKDQMWVRLERIQFVGACNPPTDPGRVPLSHRFMRHTPLLLVDFPSEDSLKQIYGTFNRALLKLHPNLKSFSSPLTDAMVDFYVQNHTKFVPDDQPHYVYSPRELSRWIRALYEALKPLDSINLNGLVRLWTHEALRLFHDRLVTEEEREWCVQTATNIAQSHFPAVSSESISQPILYTTWLSKYYMSVTRDQLREHVEAKLKVFYEEELNVPLVVFDSVLDHCLRIDRVLRQPLGHLLLVGESGAGKTVLSRFVAWMNGLSVFQIKVNRRYSIDDFHEDLRSVLKRSGCNGEKICFIFDESNVLNSSFLESMNALLASGEVPGLFEGDEYTALLNACREAAARDGVIIDTEEELFKRFTNLVQRNLHVVFTMNPAAGDFKSRATTSPALFNRCVVDWFGDWSHSAFLQVAFEFTRFMDLDNKNYTITPTAEVTLETDRLDSESNNSIHPHRASIVSSIVHCQESVRDLCVKLEKRQSRHNFISPRDYMDFIKHYVDLFNEKRDQLVDQQLHLNVGLQKLKETEVQVSSMQESLSKKKKELEQKNKLANEKLQQMLTDQNEAERKKEEAKKISASLSIKDEAIQVRQKEVQKELAEAEPALIEAQKSVGNIKKAHLDEVRGMANPPRNVQLTLEVVCLMLGMGKQPWTEIRKIIRKEDFIPSVVQFKTDDLDDKTRKLIATQYLNIEDFDEEAVQRASKACGPLFAWARSQIHYKSILNTVQPLRDEVTNLQNESAGVRQNYAEMVSVINKLEQSIDVYKQEYASLIAEVETIKSDMLKVGSKVERSTRLLDSLSSERVRWELESTNFKSQMDTLAGDSLIAAAFLTYVGFFNYKQRRSLISDIRNHLDDMGIVYTPEGSLIEYLSKPDDRVNWQASGLPTDDLCLENAIILSRYNRYPLILDPAGQASEFLLQHYKDRKISITSFLDASFMKNLESALRFGTTLLVTDVDTIDPILNPVLNREFHKTGGRVLVRLGDQDIDFSPSFAMFMTTRDANAKFAPDLCSRVTFVNFTVTPSSLQSQCLTKILKVERPDIDKKRSDLLKLQGEFQMKLRKLEDLVLDALSKVGGNILDDDNVMNTLENLKTEAADVALERSKTDIVLKEVDEVSNFYEPFSLSCSRIYFCVESLSDVHFLYQFSLQFFMDMVNEVLLGKGLESVTDKTIRRKEMLNYIFKLAYVRVNRGMLLNDSLSLALRFTQMYLIGSPLAPSDEEYNALLQRGEVTTVVSPLLTSIGDRLKAALPFLNSAKAASLSNLIVSLSTNSSSLFFKLLEHIEENASLYINCLSHSEPEKNVPLFSPSFPPSRTVFGNCLLMKALRPDRFTAAAELWVNEILGENFAFRQNPDLKAISLNESNSRSPLLLASMPGYDASSKVDDLALVLKKRLQSVAMGSSEGYELADKAINTGSKEGTWVLLRNVHLCPSWLSALEKRLHSSSPHSDFRLIMTSEIHPKIPSSLLSMCNTIVFEPSSGLRASLLRTFASIPVERCDAQPAERCRLYFLLSWLHAVIQERLRYAPIGWTKRYEFSDADARCALDSIDSWLNSTSRGKAHIDPANIPWKALRTLLSESIYGGRVDNPFDDKLLSGIIESVFTEKAYNANYSLVLDIEHSEGEGQLKLTVPEGVDRNAFLRWIEGLPNYNSPTWLGLPSYAEHRLLADSGVNSILTLSKLQNIDEELAYDNSKSGDTVKHSKKESLDSRPAWMTALEKKANKWLSFLPKIGPSLERNSVSIINPLYRALEREFTIGNSLLTKIRNDLTNIVSVITGVIKGTNYLRSLMNELSRDILPKEWSRFYIVPECSASVWIKDFGQRIFQLQKLASISLNDIGAKGVWLGGLFNPEGYITATRQVVAQTHKWSLGELKLAVTLHESGSNISIADDQSFILSEIVLEGATWSKKDYLSPTIEGGKGSENIVHVDRLCLKWYHISQAEKYEKNTQDTVPLYLNSSRDKQ